MPKSFNSRELLEQLRRRNQSFADKKSPARAKDKLLHSTSAWKRETYCLPRTEARLKAKAFLRKFPKAAYWTEIESWRVLENDVIEFTMRRLPTAD